MIEDREYRAAKALVRQVERDKRRQAKAAREKRPRPTAEGQRQPRVRDPAYLQWVRRLPCAAGHLGGCEGPIEAAHLRMSIPGRPNPGMGQKPDDVWVTPLCRHHHQHDQHRGSEAAFWARLGIDPFALCQALRRAYEAVRPGENVILVFQDTSR